MGAQGMKDEVIESMTRIEWKGLTIRVWGCQKRLTFRYLHIEETIHEELAKITDDTFNVKQVIAAILKAGEIAAIEILDDSKNGVVYYPDWS